METSLEAVVFDFGGVFVTPINGMVKDAANHHGLTIDETLELLIGPRDKSTIDHPWHRAERGELPISELQAEIVPFAEALGLELRGDEYDSLFGAGFSVVEPIAALPIEARERGCKTALLTNSFVEYRPILESIIDFSMFDVVIDSSEVRCRKPDPLIYELTQQTLDVAPEHIAYLDDFQGNIDGGKRAGWQTIHVTDAEQTVADLRYLLGSEAA